MALAFQALATMNAIFESFGRGKRSWAEVDVERVNIVKPLLINYEMFPALSNKIF
jgi:hypothetical protein